MIIIFKTFLFLLLFIAQAGYGQFYLSEEVLIDIVGPNTFVSSQETNNIINVTISGTGAFALLGTNQEVTSKRKTLVLHNLHIANANNLALAVNLQILGMLKIQSGTLFLNHILVLKNKKALVLQTNAVILETVDGLLVFDSDIASPLPTLFTINTHNITYLNIYSHYSALNALPLQEKTRVYPAKAAMLYTQHQNIESLPPRV